jgi:hypothetical protein
LLTAFEPHPVLRDDHADALASRRRRLEEGVSEDNAPRSPPDDDRHRALETRPAAESEKAMIGARVGTSDEKRQA